MNHNILYRLAKHIVRPEKGFGAATEHEPIVFGARRPGFPLPSVPQVFVEEWMTFMIAHNIKRIVCLLPENQLRSYHDLLGSYRNAFDIHKVCWAPIADFHLADVPTLTGLIVPFLAESDHMQEKVVVHCSGGIGRTGHVLAAWLVSFRGMSNQEAIAAIKRSGRNAQESGDKRLDTLLNTCRQTFVG